jgi:hypothetical protein
MGSKMEFFKMKLGRVVKGGISTIDAITLDFLSDFRYSGVWTNNSSSSVTLEGL